MPPTVKTDGENMNTEDVAIRIRELRFSTGARLS